MPPSARALSEADRALWASYASQIAPLPGRVGVAAPVVASGRAAEVSRPVVAAVSRGARVVSPLAVGTQPGGIDKATWRRFESGKLLTARTLDLHGMTAQRAFHALVSFIRSAYAEQVRCVEIVTGRGSGEAGGVIRRELPMWLNLPEIRPLILAAAHPHALNPGSVRLILRRIR